MGRLVEDRVELAARQCREFWSVRIRQKALSAQFATPRRNVVEREAGRSRDVVQRIMQPVITLAAQSDFQRNTSLPDFFERRETGLLLHRKGVRIFRRDDTNDSYGMRLLEDSLSAIRERQSRCWINDRERCLALDHCIEAFDRARTEQAERPVRA